MGNKVKHLELIQGVVDRMSRHSFLLKGWTVALVVGILTLVKNGNVHYFTIIPILIFWILDAYYIQHERLFRSLFDAVRVKAEEEIDFGMDISDYKKDRNRYICVLVSPTLIVFYGLLLASVLIFIKYF